MDWFLKAKQNDSNFKTGWMKKINTKYGGVRNERPEFHHIFFSLQGRKV